MRENFFNLNFGKDFGMKKTRFTEQQIAYAVTQMNEAADLSY